MKTCEFDYKLPKELIAQYPMEPRDHSRLMVAFKNNGIVQYRHFYDLPKYLNRGDLLVFNDSKVIPARLYGRRLGTGGRIELLLLNRLASGRWKVLVKPGRRLKEGTTFEIPSQDSVNVVTGVTREVCEDGTRIIGFSEEDRLGDVGVIPLPPHIHERLEDPNRYQTVYAGDAGSIAAPTAGLHFTSTLLEKIRSVGAETVFVHVGWDSFRPVKEEDILSHEMHSEYWELDQNTADAINRAKQEGRRVISVGTTAARLLEQAALLKDSSKSPLIAGSGWTNLFITPGHEFRILDSLVTNFHLPKSTLLMMVSAFGERDFIFKAYQQAVNKGYRFYTFGDAMLVL